MKDVAIRVENLGKRYRIGVTEERPDNLREAASWLVGVPFRYLRTRLHEPGPEEILWALKDVSFEVRRGEVLGIIGRNGAGKSTLLKILSRITEPTEGHAEIHGRVGSLLEVGTGFHQELTGRENIYLNGAILGMTKPEIDRKFDEIVAFSGVEKFIDTPVKRYSSGMRVRLAFSVAAHLDPEILLIDEVLAVGDVAFQRKCLDKMGEVAKEGRTVLFVSHNMGAVKALCDWAVLLSGGQATMSGSTDEVIDFYLKDMSSRSRLSATWGNSSDSLDSLSEITLQAVALLDSSGDVRDTFKVEEPIRVVLNYKVNQALRALRLVIQLQTSDGIVAFSTYEDSTVIQDKKVLPGEYRAECIIPPNLLNIDAYNIWIAMDQPKVKVIIPPTPVVKVQVLESSSYYRYHRTSPGALRPELEWSTQALEGDKGGT